MAYEIKITRQAAKMLKRMPGQISKAIRKELGKIASDPFAHNPKVTKLQNREGYRLRVGNWRVIYEIQKEEIVILVLKIGSRGEVYR